MEKKGVDVRKLNFTGAIPLQLHLHDSEVTSHPPPLPLQILAPRMGYLPLLAPMIKSYFSSALPPGEDTLWFEYKGLPLKWYLQTGVLFDLLCAEPQRPWNLTVHFRGYPSKALIPCEGDDAVKWSFINSLKEAAYIINGNCKNIMNMSQSDQSELWRSVIEGNQDSFLKVTSKLKLRIVEDKDAEKLYPSPKPLLDADNLNTVKTVRIPVRMYVRTFMEAFDGLLDAPDCTSWEEVSYINRPLEFNSDEAWIPLCDALKLLLPEYFEERPGNEKSSGEEGKEEHLEDPTGIEVADKAIAAVSERSEFPQRSSDVEIKLIRVQGIDDLRSGIPMSWVVNNLMHADHYLHICVYMVRSQSSLSQYSTPNC